MILGCLDVTIKTTDTRKVVTSRSVSTVTHDKERHINAYKYNVVMNYNVHFQKVGIYTAKKWLR